jgi:hypothetical protein
MPGAPDRDQHEDAEGLSRSDGATQADIEGLRDGVHGAEFASGKDKLCGMIKQTFRLP